MNKLLFLLVPILSLCSCDNGQEKELEIEFKSFEVVTIQPFFDRMGDMQPMTGWEIPDGFTKYNQLLSGAGQYLSKNIPTISFKESNISKNEVLNPEVFSKLGKNQIIMFEGHGSFEVFYEEDPDAHRDRDPEMHSVMWTGQDYDESKEKTDPDYVDYCYVRGDNFNEALTMNFIEKYVGDLTGSIVYLGNCYSARDCTFAQSFLNKGAEAVIGNSHTTQAQYNSVLEYTTMKFLTKINPETKKTYTLFEAQEEAKKIYGHSDREKHEVACSSEAILFGNANFRIQK